MLNFEWSVNKINSAFKIQHLAFFIAFIPVFVSAQNWIPVGHGISVDSSKEDIEDPVKTLCVYDGKLYIGGAFKDKHRKHLKSIACWNGKIIDTVGTGIDGAVWTLSPYNKDLCIGGRFEKRATNGKWAGGIVLWNDTTGVSTSMDNPSGIIYTTCIYQKYLYKGGGFWHKNISGIAKWNGISWDSVGGNVRYTNMVGLLGYVEAMTEFNGKLYAKGLFHISNMDDTYYIACWDGEKWQGIGKAETRQNLGHDVIAVSGGTMGGSAMIRYKGYLYAGGDFDSINSMHIGKLARWNDTTWSSVGSFSQGAISAIAVYNDKLYVGGIFDSINGKPIRNIACWDGKSWSAVGNGLEFSSSNKYFKGRVKSLAVYNNELYAGGTFNFSGKTHLNNLAKWSTTNVPIKK